MNEAGDEHLKASGGKNRKRCILLHPTLNIRNEAIHYVATKNTIGHWGKLENGENWQWNDWECIQTLSLATKVKRCQITGEAFPWESMTMNSDTWRQWGRLNK